MTARTREGYREIALGDPELPPAPVDRSLGSPTVTSRAPEPRDAPGSPPPASAARRVLAVLVALQGALLVVVAALYLVQLATGEPRSVPGAVGILLLAGLGGLGLLAVGRALLRGRRWGRSPALVTQLIVLPVALASFPDGWYVGGPLLVWAVAVLVLLFVPSVSDELRD